MFIYTETSGTRSVEIDISSVSAWFKPYIGWVGDDNGETLTTEIRASFDNGSTWTSWATVSNRDELTDAFNETTETHADIIEVKQTLETTDQEVSPWVDQVFIYFPDYDPVITSDLPSLDFEINVYNHVDFVASLPSFLLDADLYNDFYDRSVDLEGDIPSLTAAIGGGAGLINSLPSLTLEAEGDSGRSIEFSATLPSLTAEIFVGSKMVGTLPSLDLSTDVTKTEPADLIATLPAFQFAATVYSGAVTTISGTLPMFSMDIDSDSAITASLINNLPILSLSVSVLAGNLAEIDCTIPSLQSRISSSITGNNEIDVTLPSFTALIESGELSGVLRYVKGTIR